MVFIPPVRPPIPWPTFAPRAFAPLLPTSSRGENLDGTFDFFSEVQVNGSGGGGLPIPEGTSFVQSTDGDYTYDFQKAVIPVGDYLNIQISDDGANYYNYTWYVSTDPTNPPFEQSHYDPAIDPPVYTNFTNGQTYYMRFRHQNAQPSSDTTTPNPPDSSTEWSDWVVDSFVAVVPFP